MTPAILPFVHAQGSWGEIGRQVGQMCAPAIERHLAAWTRHVVEQTGCSPETVEATAARQYPKDAPAALLYTTAGLLGHNGLNEAGVGVCANFVDDPEGWGDGLPRYLLSRLALREPSAEAACAAALAPPRAASRNLLIADDRGTILDVEALRGRAAVLRPRDGLLVHANHLEAAEFQGCETPSENSRARRARLTALFEAARAPVTVAGIQVFYRDHANDPHSLCAHPFPGRNLQTVASVIADLTRRELHASKGAPCRSPYATYTLATCQTGALSVTVRDRFQPAVPG